MILHRHYLTGTMLLGLVTVGHGQNPTVTVPDTNSAAIAAALTQEFAAQGFALLSAAKLRVTYQRDQGRTSIRGQLYPLRLEVLVIWSLEETHSG